MPVSSRAKDEKEYDAEGSSTDLCHLPSVFRPAGLPDGDLEQILCGVHILDCYLDKILGFQFRTAG